MPDLNPSLNPNLNRDPASNSTRDTLQTVMTVALILLGSIDLVRGGIHWLAPDSGAHSIAGMDLHNAGGANIVFLLATDGIGQMAWGVLYILVALRERRYLRFIFLLEAAKSAMILFTEYVLKPPVPAVPGRFMHMTTLVVATILFLLS
jgi:hypothetical protein